MGCYSYRFLSLFRFFIFLFLLEPIVFQWGTAEEILERKTVFNIPNTIATESLRVFAMQSGESLIFSLDEIEGVHTEAISVSIHVQVTRLISCCKTHLLDTLWTLKRERLPF